MTGVSQLAAPVRERRVAANAAVLAALRIAAPLCSLVIVLAISRRLGAEGLGRYSLAYAFLAVFGLLGSLGLPERLTRDGARDSSALGRLLSSGLLLGGAVSLGLTLAMAGAGRLLGYDPLTTRALFVLALGVVPSTWLGYFDAAFLSLESTAPIAVAALVEHAAKIGLGIAALVVGLGLDAVLAAAVAGKGAACAVSWVLLRRRGVRISLAGDRASLRSLAAQAPVFTLRAACATLYWRIDVFLLAHFRPVAEVGYYTAAYRLLDVAVLLPQSLCLALFPRLAGDRAGEPRWRPAALSWLLLLTAPLALVVSLLARPLLAALYGSGLAIAAPLLSILIWTVAPYAWNRYHAYLLVAADQQHVDLAINAAMLALNIALNLVLIPRYGALGAALVTLATALVYGAAQLAWLKRRSSQVNSLVGFLIRGRRFQLCRRSRLSRQYLNVGCGANAHPDFINLDYNWSPEIDLCWDITKGLPVRNRSLQGIFTEHCLEHISFDDCGRILAEFRRLLRPGGWVRIVVPDAEMYLDLYHRAKRGEAIAFPVPALDGDLTPMMHVNRTFRAYGHRFAYDFETLRRMLLRAGFTDVRREQFRLGADPALLMDSARRRAESVYIEARVPQL